MAQYRTRVAQNCLKMYSRCTPDVLQMYSRCTQDVLKMYSGCPAIAQKDKRGQQRGEGPHGRNKI